MKAFRRFFACSAMVAAWIALAGCFSARTADANSLPDFGKGHAAGQIHDGWLTVQIRPDAGETWPAAGPSEVWLARLDGKREAAAAKLEYRPDEQVALARIPYGSAGRHHGPYAETDVFRPGAEALHLLCYRVVDPAGATTHSMSLAEAVGSLELRLVARTTFQAGSQAAARAVATNRFNGEPLSGAAITVAFADKEGSSTVFTGMTGPDGGLDLSFQVPATPLTEPALVVEAAWRGQVDEVREAAQIHRDAKVLLTTDKPLYQPGQTMHVRALALSQAARRPVAEQDALIEIRDAKGNKVFKKAARSDAYGIFHADFTLADEVNMGAYQIAASIAESRAEKTVEVKRYALPKFKVQIDADRAWYLPRQLITGVVKADYVFGKPTANADVTVEGLATIVGVETFATIKGKTDGEGRFTFEMQTPEILTGTQADQGKARVQLHVTVVDPAGHTQEALRSFPVAKAPLVIQALPESGQLIAGLHNRVYVMVTTPDGSPAAARVAALPGNPPREDGWQKTAQAIPTDRYGIAEFEIDAPERGEFVFTIRARDDRGNEVAETLRLRPEREPLALLLRADQPTYNVGDVIHLTAHVGKSATPTIYFDLVRQNQTLLTTSANVTDGVATVDVPATDDLAGGVVATAYVFATHGNLVRDTRALYINPAADLHVDIRPDKEVHRPGENAAIDFAVADAGGHPVAAALGVTIVDEAVFALQDMQPGLEKIFFTLEKELMTPRYEAHSFDPAFIVLRPHGDPELLRAQQVMFAAVKPALLPPTDRKIATDMDPEVRKALEKQVRADLRRIARKYAKSSSQKHVPTDAELDPWSTPYRVYAEKNIVYRLDSAGPDRKFGTEDDISVTDDTALAKVEGSGNHGRRVMAKGAAMPDMAAFADIAPPMPMAAQAGMGMKRERVDKPAVEEQNEAGKKTGGEAAVRVREYFPETLYVNPALITGPDGRAHVELPMADSITTWRVAALAVSRDGWLGSGTAPLRVFQDFFIDIDFPATLTRGDSVSVPIALYNYLAKPQTVTLKFAAGDWFELLEGGLTRTVSLAPNEVKAEWLKLKATSVGRHELTVVAKGSNQSDAVKRAVLIEPDGKMFESEISDRLQNEKHVNVNFPGGTVPGADKLFVKIHPGLMSQVLEGLDNIFRMPYGCFEQTSSTTYPNVMALAYLKATRQATPELQMKAEGFINQGYQRLLTFEVPGGGFEWFGRAPAHVILTAYGLMEFSDMSKVYNVDADVIRRTQRWLAAKQQPDGSWQPSARVLDAVAAAFTTDVVRNTAYVAWALARTGEKGGAVAKGVSFLEGHRAQAKDAYTVALVANALVEGGAKPASLDAVFAQLAQLRTDEGEISYWPSPVKTALRGGGKSADIETTALAALALLRANREPQVVNRVATYLIRSKDAFGTYYSTQATVWALHVLLGVAQAGAGDINGQATVVVNGQRAGEFRITPADSDVLRQIDASGLVREGDNDVELSFAGKGEPAFQVVGRYYLPWDRHAEEKQKPITIDVAYDKTRLAVAEEVVCTTTVANHAPGDFGMVVIDVGIPPGFAPVAETLAKLVESKQIAKFSATARQATFYIDKLAMHQSLTLSFKLKALYPVRAVAPESKAYDYYNPDTSDIAPPAEFTVK